MSRLDTLNKVVCTAFAGLLVVSVTGSAPDTVALPNQQTVSQKSGDAETYMALRPSGTHNRLGNPIYTLKLYVTGEIRDQFNAVTGRAHTQSRDRNVAGTEAPLPDGFYSISQHAYPISNPETGGLFLPIYPNFSTGRTELGIHLDPSYEVLNGEDGTSGCIGLTSPSALQQVLQYVQQYRPQHLKVDLQ